MRLVTTALWDPAERLENIIFLGRWCLPFDRVGIEECQKYRVVGYHWDDRRKLSGDYRFLSTLYEEYLDRLHVELNRYHGIDESNRYWRIILGPWLRLAIECIWDRYETVRFASKHHLREISSVQVSSFVAWEDIPRNFLHFWNIHSTDIWNKYVFEKAALKILPR